MNTQRIGFKRHLRPQVVRGEAVYLFSERGVTAIAGSHVELLAPLLDGTRDLATLLSELPEGVCAEQVGATLTRLRAAGLVGDRECDADPAALAYWDATGADSARVTAALGTARVSVVTVGDGVEADAAAMTDALRANGLEITDNGVGDLTVVLCSDYLDPALAEVEAAHQSGGKPWLIVKPSGTEVWVGPLFTPGDGACWHCVAARLYAHRPAEAHVRQRNGQTGPAPRNTVRLPSVSAIALNTAATEVTRWLAGKPGDRQEVWAFDSLTSRVTHHEVRARPQCLACGDPEIVAAQAHRPVVMIEQKKRSTSGGGHRSASPQDVLNRFGHLVSPISGVIKEIRRDPRGPEGFCVYRSSANVASGARSLRGLHSALRNFNGGKGVTPLDAEVGALCEALERHSATFHGDEAMIRGSYARLVNRGAMHPDDIQLYHPEQFAGREAWNARHSSFQHVAAPFDEHAEMEWTPVWSLTKQRHRLLPTGMLYFGAPTHPSIVTSSNGCAAGSSVEDAILQGLLELVERDAVALWWYNRTVMPSVDLDAYADPWLDGIRQTYREMGREMWVLDLTADLEVPVFAAVSRRVGGEREDIVFGMGAHLDPRVALRRAVTELNQLMASVHDLPAKALPEIEPDLRDWLLTATTANQPYVAPSGRKKGPDDYGYVHHDDISADVELVHGRLRDLGMELLVLDQTRPDIALPVVRVVVPGLRHFWSRFAQGRLYDVPVRLGRVESATTYDDLNPIPMFM